MAKVAAPSPLPWEIPPKGGLSQGGRTWDPPCGFRRVNPPTLSSPLQEERVGNLATSFILLAGRLKRLLPPLRVAFEPPPWEGILEGGKATPW